MKVRRLVAEPMGCYQLAIYDEDVTDDGNEDLCSQDCAKSFDSMRGLERNV